MKGLPRRSGNVVHFDFLRLHLSPRQRMGYPISENHSSVRTPPRWSCRHRICTNHDRLVQASTIFVIAQTAIGGDALIHLVVRKRCRIASSFHRMGSRIFRIDRIIRTISLFETAGMKGFCSACSGKPAPKVWQEAIELDRLPVLDSIRFPLNHWPKDRRILGGAKRHPVSRGSTGNQLQAALYRTLNLCIY